MSTYSASSPRPVPDSGSGLRDDLIAAVYDELVLVAAKYLRQERSNHTLEPSALVHEAYMRLTEQDSFEWQNENQVIAVAALMMRRVLTDHARGHYRKKRGGGLYRVDISEAEITGGGGEIDLLELDEALESFSRQYPQECKIIELRFFGGLSIHETAEVLELSESTVKRDFRFARAWLLRELAVE